MDLTHTDTHSPSLTPNAVLTDIPAQRTDSADACLDGAMRCGKGKEVSCIVMTSIKSSDMIFAYKKAIMPRFREQSSVAIAPPVPAGGLSKCVAETSSRLESKGGAWSLPAALAGGAR